MVELVQETIQSRKKVMPFFVNYGDHQKCKQTKNTRYLISQQQYPDSVSCFQRLAGWTPLTNLVLVKSLCPITLFSWPFIGQTGIHFFPPFVDALWTIFVHTFCGHFSGQFFGHILLTLFVNTFCEHFLWTLFVFVCLFIYAVLSISVQDLVLTPYLVNTNSLRPIIQTLWCRFT